MFKRKVQLHCNGANDDVRGTDDDDYGGGYIFDGYERAATLSTLSLPHPLRVGCQFREDVGWLGGAPPPSSPYTGVTKYCPASTLSLSLALFNRWQATIIQCMLTVVRARFVV